MQWYSYGCILSIVFTLAVTTTTAAQRTGTTPRSGAWRTSTSRSEMTGQRNVTITLRASASVDGQYGPVRPTLVVRCREGELEAYVSTNMVLDSDLDDDSPVRLRWDDLEPVESFGSISSDHEAVFIVDPFSFVNEAVIQAKRLHVEFHPYDSTPRVASFGIRGFASFLPTLQRACPDAGLVLPGDASRPDTAQHLPEQ
jgi:hypothetical protein